MTAEHTNKKIKTEKQKLYPCFRGDTDPCYIHVVVQQVEFRLQRQDQTTEECHVSKEENTLTFGITLM